MGFHQVNNDAVSTLAATYSTGGTTLTVASGHGSRFGSPTPSNPIYITCVTSATVHTDSEVRTHFEATGRTSDQLTGVSVVSGSTDRNFAIGDAIEMRLLDAHLEEIHSAATTAATDIDAVETSVAAAALKANNLSDLANAGTARTNLGLGTAAVQNVGAFAQVANNLSDVTAATARTNLSVPAKVATTVDNAIVRSDGTSGQQQASNVLIDDNDAIAGFRGLIRTISGTSDTPASSDTGKILKTTSGSAVTITLPDSLPEGWNVLVIQHGAGQITFVGGGGSNATLENRQTHTKSAGQKAQVSLVCVENSDNSSAVVNLGGDTAS